MLKDALLKVKILDGTELDKRLTRTTVKFENDLTITLPNSLIHLQEKTVIPKVVGDWIFKSQLIDRRSLRSALETATIRLYAKNGDEVIDWLKDTSNQDIFARAWANGYEDEKEKKYTVKFKATRQYLCDDEIGPHFDPSFRTNFTKPDLEKLGLAEVFNSPLFEVEEVTK